MGNQQGDTYLQTLYSLKLGDGAFVTQGTRNTSIQYNTINEDYLRFREEILKQGGPVYRGVGYSGYTGRPINNIRTRVREEFKEVRELSIKEVISRLDRFGFMQLLLDDGSWHKRKNHYNLYVNTFTKEEADTLADKIYEMYPVKRPGVKIERKRDGREFNYLYIPVPTSREIRDDLEKFLKENELYSLYYKVGIPSTTIESTQKSS